MFHVCCFLYMLFSIYAFFYIRLDSVVVHCIYQEAVSKLHSQLPPYFFNETSDSPIVRSVRSNKSHRASRSLAGIIETSRRHALLLVNPRRQTSLAFRVTIGRIIPLGPVLVEIELDAPKNRAVAIIRHAIVRVPAAGVDLAEAAYH